jgi:hypothetical protein
MEWPQQAYLQQKANQLNSSRNDGLISGSTKSVCLAHGQMLTESDVKKCKCMPLTSVTAYGKLKYKKISVVNKANPSV